MKKYLIRSVKYLIALCVLYVVLMWLMNYSEQSLITFAERWKIMFSTWRGWSMIAGTVLLAATYPLFGYVKREVKGNIVTDRNEIDMAAEAAGLHLIAENESELVYRSNGLRRLIRLGEDEVRIRQKGSQIEVEGLRSSAVRLAFDAERYIKSKERRENEA